MDILTQAYVADPDAFIKEMRAAYRDVMTLFDANMNNMIEMDEHVRTFKVFGHVSDTADMASFQMAYKGAESIPLEEVVNLVIEFRTGTATTAQNDTIDEAIQTALHEEL